MKNLSDAVDDLRGLIFEYLRKEAIGSDNAKSPRAIARGILGNNASPKDIQQVSMRLSNIYRAKSCPELSRKPGKTTKRYWYYISTKVDRTTSQSALEIPEQPILASEAEEITDRFMDSLADKLAQKFVDRLEPRLQDLKREIINTILSQKTLPGTSKQNTPEKKKLPSILVIGPLQGQGRRLKNEYRGLANIRVVHSDDKATLAADPAKNADLTIVWTNFVGHDVEMVLKKVNVVPVRISGGLDQIIRKISEWLLEEKGL